MLGGCKPAGAMSHFKERPLSGIQLGNVGVPGRPKPASRLAPKQPDGEPSLFMFRFYEAAVRNLTHSARSRHHAS